MYYSSNDTSEITVQWTTTNKPTSPTVRYGTQQGALRLLPNSSRTGCMLEVSLRRRAVPLREQRNHRHLCAA